jgi:quercetin dioxygenase-like cupin family protein
MSAAGPVHRRASAQRWRATEHVGVEVTGLRRGEEGGGAALLRVAAGARFPLHDHPGGEEVYVVSGRARIGDLDVEAGDYLWTPPGGIHDLEARDETVIFVTTPNGIRVLEGDARPAS